MVGLGDLEEVAIAPAARRDDDRQPAGDGRDEVGEAPVWNAVAEDPDADKGAQSESGLTARWLHEMLVSSPGISCVAPDQG